LILASRWDNRFLRWLLEVCGAIVHEGTRSGDGRLQVAHPGTVLLALRSQAPTMPIAYYGSEQYKRNVKRLRRTDFHIAVGRPYYLDSQGHRISRQIRRQMINEVMYQMAALIPLD
jgi:hypothetical protein